VNIRKVSFSDKKNKIFFLANFFGAIENARGATFCFKKKIKISTG
jgi:hypothetical protein